MPTWSSTRPSEDMREWSARKHGLCPACGVDLDLGCDCSDAEPYQPVTAADTPGRDT